MLQGFSLKPRNPLANKQTDFYFLEPKTSQLRIPMVIPYGHERITLGEWRRGMGAEEGKCSDQGQRYPRN
jgi:hypothetical protein